MTRKILLFSALCLSFCSGNSARITSATLVTVNNRTISKDDFAQQIETIKNTPGVDLSSKDGRLLILKDMINEELVFQDALKEEFHLKNLDLKHEIVKEFLKQKFSKDLPTISEEQLKETYKTNQAEIDQIRASHILIKAKDEASKNDAKQRIQKIYNDILQKKISFGDAASRYGEDSSKDVGGDLGFFPKSRMVPAFAEAAFALKNVGDISGIVETNFGYHIIMLTADQRGYEANKEKIRWKISQDKMQPLVGSYFNELKEHSKVEIKNQDLMAVPVLRE